MLILNQTKTPLLWRILEPLSLTVRRDPIKERLGSPSVSPVSVRMGNSQFYRRERGARWSDHQKQSYTTSPTSREEDFSKLRKFSSFLYNDSPVSKEDNVSRKKEETDTKVIKLSKYPKLTSVFRFPGIFQYNQTHMKAEVSITN